MSEYFSKLKPLIIKGKKDIVIAKGPGLPCGLPFRIIRQSSMYQSAIKRFREPKCNKDYVLLKDAEGKFSCCPTKENNEHHFCICNGLLSSVGYNPDKEKPRYTVGTNINRVCLLKPLWTNSQTQYQ